MASNSNKTLNRCHGCSFNHKKAACKFMYAAFTFWDQSRQPKKIRQAITAKINPHKSAVSAAARVCRMRRICTAPKYTAMT